MFSKVLVLAPHVDDGELGCGASIAKFVEEGKDVIYVAFSIARTSSAKNGMPENILEIEVKDAIARLGIKNDNLIIYDYEVRYFYDKRQSILQNLVDLKKQLSPDLVFVPSLNDIHQDHQVIAREGLRAFKDITVLGYEEPWNNIVFETKSFIILEERHVKKKIEALKCYNSQKHRTYLDDKFIWSLAKTRGVQLEGGYAEAFEVLRYVIR